MEKLLADTNVDFREYRLAYIKEVIEIVMYENDDISKKIHQYINTRKCSNSLCAKGFESMKRKCDICDSKVVVKKIDCVTILYQFKSAVRQCFSGEVQNFF